MSTHSTANSYKKRSDFIDAAEYEDYVKTKIKPGVKVRRINGDSQAVSEGETGVVTEVQKYVSGIWEIYADWDVAGENVCGGWCEDMELID